MISVVIPTFNSAPLVVGAVESALGQSLTPGEIIVVDDGSTDDTRVRLERFGARIRYFWQENSGVAAARNLGLSKASGEFLAFLDADDVWHPRKLEMQLEAMTERPEVELLGTMVGPCSIADSATIEGGGLVARVAWADLVVRNCLVTSSVMVRRAVLERIGEFDTRLQGPEDHDLWLRIAEVGVVANLDLRLTGYRDAPNTLSQQSQTMQAGMRRILFKLDQRNAWQGRLLLRRKAYGYCEYSCAYMESAAGRPGRAMRNLAYSFAWYPFFYRRAEMRFSLARVRMWTILLARLLRIGRGRPALGCASGISMNTAGKVRERKGFVRRALKPIVRTFLSGHVPVISITKPLFAALYRLHAGVREGLIWARRFFWHEPLFRSQCASVGRGFRMEALPYITGRGRIVIGERVRLSGKSGIGFGNRKMGQPEIIIGDDTFIGHDCHFGVGESIRIGKHCLIARGVSVRDMDGHPLDAERRRAGESTPAQGIRPVVIEDDVWIGVGTVILKGVTIGARSIVGTGAVVSKDVPPDSVVAGNPARVVRRLVAEAAISQAEAA